MHLWSLHLSSKCAMEEASAGRARSIAFAVNFFSSSRAHDASEYMLRHAQHYCGFREVYCCAARNVSCIGVRLVGEEDIRRFSR